MKIKNLIILTRKTKKNRPTPNTKEHLTQVLRAYLQGKGALNDKHIEFEI